jgi:F-type H+-transporting ATPase subunit delta
MAELSTLARPYAEAVFKRAKQSGNIEQWSSDVAFIATLAQDSSVIALLNNPRTSKSQLTELLLDVSQEQVGDEAKNLLKLLIENRRLALAPKIAELYAERVAEDQGYVNVRLFSAYALSKAEQSKYSAMLEKQLQKKVNAEVIIDKSLIGGILAKAGDKVLDGSIRGQIHQLAKRL